MTKDIFLNWASCEAITIKEVKEYSDHYDCKLDNGLTVIFLEDGNFNAISYTYE